MNDQHDPKCIECNELLKPIMLPTGDFLGAYTNCAQHPQPTNNTLDIARNPDGTPMTPAEMLEGMY
jgi:hypothetical protein